MVSAINSVGFLYDDREAARLADPQLEQESADEIG